MKIKKILRTALLLSLLLCASLITITPCKSSFDLSQVAYYEHVKSVLSLNSEQEAALSTNGFIIVDIPNKSSDDYFYPKTRFEDFYYALVYANDLPVFVTTDSILHLFHVVFDCSLRILENDTFYSVLFEVTQFAFNSSLNDYKSLTPDNSLKYWAIRNSTVYFAVALSLLTGETVKVPEQLLADTNFYIDHICADSPVFVRGAGYWFLPEPPWEVEVEYDFTQFKVRGHYLGELRLERYFRTFMWFGNYPVFIPRNDEQYVWFAPHIDEAAIVYMRDMFKSNPDYYEKWMLLYNVTSDLVGESDSINVPSLEVALQNVFGIHDRYLDYVASENGLFRLKEELSRSEYQQQILSQALVAQMPAKLPRYPTVFHFMGQRYVPDSYVFQMLCWDKVGYNPEDERRIMPKGIDVFAVLGSERAYQLLIPDFDFENYTSNARILEQNFKNLTEEDWTESSYMAWVHALQSLIETQQNDSLPQFMRTLAWQDEKLNTALGSWAQLRHDTILYAKQTYIPAFVCSYPEAFVEPDPSFYSRMQALSERTIRAVETLKPESVKPAIISSLETLKTVSEKLEMISEKELANEPLTPEEIKFIKEIAWMCGSGGPIGWYVDTIHEIASAANGTSILDAPVIADVATFPPGNIQYPPQILHVGVGYVNALVVLFPMPNGKLVAAIGPVFSYYEFRLIGTKRLNDEEWKKILTFDNRSEYLPEWLKDIYGMGEPWPITQEYPSLIVLFTVVTLTLTVVTLAKVIKAKKWKERR